MEQGWHLINVGRRKRSGVVDARSVHVMLADFGLDFLNDGDSGEKSLQRDDIVGRWDGHTLNLGGVGRWPRSMLRVAASGGRLILIFDPSAKFYVL
jgi:hypothetical protein